MATQGAPVYGTSTPRIEVRRLTKTFRRAGGEVVLPIDDISLEVGPQEMMLLVGPSGCGKTTLLRCIAGLERPDSGEIVIDGRTVFSSAKNIFVPPEQRRLSMIFQSYALWPHMSVFANIAYPLESRKVDRKEIVPRVQRAMEMAGIGELGRQFPGRISGGQQQRVALARALVSDSTVILFDEPLSNVDARVREQLRLEMKRMQRQLRFSGLYVTHDQSEAMELGDRIAVLKDGRIAALGRPEDIYDSPNSRYVATFLGSSNIWQGSVVSISGREISLRTSFGADLRALHDKPGQLNVDAPLDIVLRSERIKITVERSQSANSIQGTITARIFGGAFCELQVDCGADEHVRVTAAHETLPKSIKEGDLVFLTFDPQWVRLLPRGA